MCRLNEASIPNSALAQYKYTYGANIFCCILCGTFATMFEAPGRYMWFMVGFVLFASELFTQTCRPFRPHESDHGAPRTPFPPALTRLPRSHVDLHRAAGAGAAGAVLLRPRLRTGGSLLGRGSECSGNY
jgi:hypothetical protein